MEKSAEAFRTISEVSELLETPAHVLRFWESRFTQVKPLKRAGGRRYYRPSDLALLGGIKKLLHDDGMTIRGVQKILREQGVRHVAALSGLAAAAAGDVAPAPEAAPPAAPPDTASRPKPAATAHAAAAPGTRLRPDPEDTVGEADEAPMEIDAPTLPLGLPDNVRTIPAGAPAEATSDGPTPAEAGRSYVAEDAGRPPAAAMLRAMDALRARDKKAELRVVFNRLTTLRDRLVERNRQTRN